MRKLLLLIVFTGAVPFASHAADRRDDGKACYVYQRACGYGPGQFRPQPFGRDPQPGRAWVPSLRSPGLYAPVGPNGRYWRQLPNGSTQPGPQERNAMDGIRGFVEHNLGTYRNSRARQGKRY